jgi:glutathione S-transferase
MAHSRSMAFLVRAFAFPALTALEPLSWEELEKLKSPAPDRVNGPTNSQALLRLFGRSESEVRVTLYRDHHAWCPYCQ